MCLLDTCNIRLTLVNIVFEVISSGSGSVSFYIPAGIGLPHGQLRIGSSNYIKIRIRAAGDGTEHLATT